MKKCKIVSIVHSGRDGSRYSPRKEAEFTELLGKHVALNMKSIEIGEGFWLNVLDESDDWYDGSYTASDKVVARRYIQSRKGTRYEIETDGSIYTFKEL